ncbi:hypothetical protein ACFOYW_04600 [Gryllotalpicola reticulitermitis]|uniref:DUF2510 domain-containing protein n=1 Tax=Gryllotalpicola reticulitermitis TaxID=1184153 RepID=A0ABV8Q4B2_9MICO
MSDNEAPHNLPSPGWMVAPEDPSLQAWWDGRAMTSLRRSATAEAAQPTPTAPVTAALAPQPPAMRSVAPMRDAPKRRMPTWAKVTIPVGSVVVAAAIVLAALTPTIQKSEHKSAAIAACEKSAEDQLDNRSAHFSHLSMTLMDAKALNSVFSDDGEPATARNPKDGSQFFMGNGAVTSDGDTQSLECLVTIEKNGKVKGSLDDVALLVPGS